MSRRAAFLWQLGLFLLGWVLLVGSLLLAWRLGWRR